MEEGYTIPAKEFGGGRTGSLSPPAVPLCCVAVIEATTKDGFGRGCYRGGYSGMNGDTCSLRPGWRVQPLILGIQALGARVKRCRAERDRDCEYLRL